MKLQENIVFANRYELQRLLGRGGFSEVWLAKDQWTHLNVAIKVYAPGQGMEEDGMREFCGELAGVYDINHSNLLKPQHVDAWENMLYLIMAYCPNGSCAKLIGKVTEEQMWKMIHDVASGLAYLHEKGLVHQDIKPANVMIDEDGHYLITDFGVSSRARSTLRKSVVSSTGGGTTAYMGPERFSKQPAPTKASDIWSLGAMCFEMLEGEVPFGENGGVSQKIGADIPLINADVSDALKYAITMMLQNETWDRPTAATLAKWAENPELINVDRSVLNLNADYHKPVDTSRPTVKKRNIPVSEPVKGSDGNKRMWIIVGVMAVVICVLGVFLFSSSNNGSWISRNEKINAVADSIQTSVVNDTIVDIDSVNITKAENEPGKDTLGLTKTVNGVVIENGVLKKVPKNIKGHFVIEEGVTKIGYKAFWYREGLTGVTIPSSVTSIGDWAFCGCSSLINVNLPNSVKNVGFAAFSECIKISEPLYNKTVFAYMPRSYKGAYAIPSGIIKIAGLAFEECRELTNVIMPNSVTCIGNYAFFYCSSLTKVNFSNSIINIGSDAFYGCSSLADVELPNSVKNVGINAFDGCEKISEPLYNKTVFAYLPRSYKGAYTIPSGIKKIAADAFSDVRQVTHIDIPEGVKSIGPEAFMSCDMLVSVTIPNSVIEIGNNAFLYSDKLTTIYVPVGTTEKFKKMLGESYWRKIVER